MQLLSLLLRLGRKALSSLVITAAALGRLQAAEEAVPPPLQQIVIPRIEFRAATPAEALTFLKQKIAGAWKAADRDQAAEMPATLDLNFDPALLPKTPITMSLRNPSLVEALRHVAALGGLQIRFRPTGVDITAAGKEALPRFGNALTDHGLSEVQRAMVTRIQNIILPRVEFRGATLRESVDFLRKRCEDADVQEPNPNLRGVNVVIREGSPSAARRLVTLKLENVTVFDLLHAIARQTGAHVLVTDSAFVLEVLD